jgi:hypothetical protein
MIESTVGAVGDLHGIMGQAMPETRKKAAKSATSGMGRRPGQKIRVGIDPDDADHPTIHGLRGTGILASAEQGYEVDQIAHDIGASRQNADHYMRFRDQMKVGADCQKRVRVVTRED